MAFVRARLSKLFRVNDDQHVGQSETTPEEQRQPSVAASVADSGYYSTATSRSRSPMKPSRPTTPLGDHRDAEDTTVESSKSPSKSLGSARSPNKRPIHKLASTTIKMFSDTIRSKATMFYTSPPLTEISRPDDTDSPTKRDRAARLLSSLRSRSSRNFNEDPQTEETEVEPRVYVDMPHELDVEIPNSSLIDHTTKAARQNSVSFLSSVVSSPTANDQARWKKDDNLSDPFGGTTIEKKSTIGGTEKAPSLIDLVSDSPGTSSAIIAKSQVGPKAVVEAPAAPGFVGVDHKSDTGSDVDVMKTIGESTTCSAMGPSSARGSLFVKGKREQERLHSSSPYRRGLLCHSARRADTEAQDSNSGRTANTAIESGELFVMSLLPADGDVTIPRGREPAQSTDVDHTDVDDQPELDRPHYVSSNSDAEDRIKCLDHQTVEIPSMGPKSEWDKLRAERQLRYHKVSGTSAVSEHGIGGQSESHLETCCDRLSDDVQTDKTTCAVGEDGFATTGEISRSRKVRFEESADPQSKKPGSGGDTESADISAAQKVEKECSGVWHEGEPSDYALSVADRTRSSILDDVDMRSLSSASTLQDIIEATDTLNHPGINSPEIASSQTHLSPAPRRYLGIEPLHIRKASSHSASTTDSCAVTTKGDFRYEAGRIPSLHVRTSPVRRTSSINAELNSAPDVPENGDFSPSIPPPEPTGPAWSMGMAASDASKLSHDILATTTEGSGEGDCECWLKLMVEVKHNVGEERKSEVLRRSFNTTRIGNDLTARSASELNVSTSIKPDAPKATSNLAFSQATNTPVRVHNTRSENLGPVRVSKESAVRRSRLLNPHYDQTPYSIEDLPPLPASVDTPYHTSGRIIEDLPPLPASVDTPYHTSGETIGLSYLCSSFSPSPIEHMAASRECVTELRLEQKRTCIESIFPDEAEIGVECWGQEEINSGSGFLNCSPGIGLRRTRRVKRGAASKLSRSLNSTRMMDERIFNDQDMERDFVAARLPNLESARSEAKTHQLRQMAVSTLDFLGSIGSEASPNLLSSINECNSADAFMGTTSSGSRRGHNKDKSLAMEDGSFSGEEFTYNAVGAPKTGFQTSSQKKGVWWDREFRGIDDRDSPLASKSTIGSPLLGKESISNVPTYCQTQTDNINDKDETLLSEDTQRSLTGDTAHMEVKAHQPDVQIAKCSTPEPLSTSQSAQEAPTTPTNDQVSLPPLFPLPHIKTLTMRTVEQGQDTDQLSEFITPSFRLQTPLQEISAQAAMEPCQEQEMVSRSEKTWIVGAFPLPRASPANASIRYLSGSSWASLDREG